MRTRRRFPAVALVASLFIAAGATGPAPIATIAGSKYTTVAGDPITLAHSQPAALAFIFISPECPISNKLIPELNRLAAVAKQKHIEFYAVISDPAVSRAEAQKHSTDYHINFPVIFDASAELARALNPKVTPQSFVLSPEGKVLYTGRINDSFAAVGKPRSVTTAKDLELALANAARNRSTPNTDAVGCKVEPLKPAADSAPGTITWRRDIAPIIYANCASCHHEGEVAPFPLMSYKDAAKRAHMIADVTGSKLMPPWKAADPWGKFHDERRLTDNQIALINAWAKAGAPEGATSDEPPAPKFSDGWQLAAAGGPDLIVKMPRPYHVPADGRDLMTYTVVPLDIPEDKYVVAFEYRPGNRKVVHHMIALLDSRGNARKIAQQKGDGTSYTSFGGPGFLPTGGLGGWAPGATPRFLPDGVGRPLKKTSDLVLQIHYHPTGKPETDQGSLALYFAKKPVNQVAINFPLMNRQIDIPAGDNNYIRTKQLTVPVNVTLFTITPHMHNLGREMKVTATFPDGKVEQLIDVNDWDWNWQDQYQLAKPIKLPRGTKIDLWARYDNSKDNPKNPQNPPGRVTFGEQTKNEMCIAFLQVTVDGLAAPLLGAIGDDNPDRNAIRQRLRNLRN